MIEQTGTLESKNGQIAYYKFSPSGPERGALVCVHGGPGGDHRGNNGIFDEMVETCCPLGYHVIQFDMFGAGDSGGQPQDITLHTQLDDYRAILEYARTHLPGPIHVAGESMGATIAAMDWQQDVASYILLWPAFDLVDTDLRPYFSEPWSSMLRRDGFIADDGIIIGRDFIDQILAYDFSSCFLLPNSPCLLVHGRSDRAVPFEQSLQAVSRAAGPSVLFAHPTGDHGLQTTEERTFTRAAYTWWMSK